MTVEINRFEMQFRTASELAAGLEPAWELTLISEMTDGFGKPARSVLGPITPTEAETYGFTFESIIEAAAAQAMSACAKAQAERDAALQAKDAADIARADMERDHGIAQQDLAAAQQDLSAAQAQITQLQAALAEATAAAAEAPQVDMPPAN